MTDFSKLISDLMPSYMCDLETFVNTDCGTHNKAGVDAIGKIMQERFREFGAEVSVFPSKEFGDCIYGRWRGKGTARIVMIGHMDTVYIDGTAKENPFRKIAGQLKGPGVGDMKSGLLSGLYAARAIMQSGFENFGEIGLFCNSEEEVGSPFSHEVYPQFVRGANAALVLESARASGAIVSARKGAGTYTVTVRGKAAHAGVEPEKGASAVIAMARYTDLLHALNGMRPGLTLNVGVVHGGTKSNVIADLAQAELDVRVLSMRDVEPLEQAMREILAREVVPGTTAEFVGGMTNPAMEKTLETAHLAELAKNAARDLGFEIEDVATGGASDGNMASSLGTPTLDGLGPVSGNGHNVVNEWTDASSIVPRTALLAKLIVAIAEGK